MVKNLLQRGTAASVTLNLEVFKANRGEAASFNFKYTFLSGETISGKLDGYLQEDGNTIVELRNIIAKYSGAGDLQYFNLVGEFNYKMTLDGSKMFVLIANADDFADVSNAVTIKENLDEQLEIVVSFMGFMFAHEREAFDSSRWQIEKKVDLAVSIYW